jgi:hypothetical protein
MKFLKLFITICLFAIALLLAPSSCVKTKYLTNGKQFSFSIDTLAFDTVFTAQGSVTKSFLITNNNNKWLRLSRIRLGGGATSPFRLNIDGQPTKDIQNIDIAPFDSVYVFAAVTVDPTAINNPFVVEDSVEVFTSDAKKTLPLIAFGQNANYVYDSVLQGNITWNSTKPYVIINSALVDSNCTLTIEPGTRIYMHSNSKLFVKGTLLANGTANDSITFCGDRLDRNYFGGDIPGEWCGLHFLQKSKNNVLTHCVIKNGGAPWKIYDPVANEFGYLTGALIYVEPNDVGISSPKVVINNCFIGLSIQYGLLAFNGNVKSTNSLYYACGSQNVAGIEGGTYSFTHCTMGNYGYKLFLRHDKYSVLQIQNYFLPDPQDISTLSGNALQATFSHCIIDGTATEGNEVLLDKLPNWPSAIDFSYCLLKQKSSLLTNATLDASTTFLLNKNADFTAPNASDFTLKPTSAAKAAGNNATGVSVDIKGKIRSNPPSIGCWE